MAAPITTVRPYDPQEDAFIRANHRTMTMAEMGRYLERHPSSVACRATALGLAAVGDGVDAHNALIIAATRRFEQQLALAADRHGVPLRPYRRALAGEGRAA